MNDGKSASRADAEERLITALSGRPLLVLLENTTDVLQRIGKQGQHALRALVQNREDVLLVATSPSLDDSVSKQAAPFYGFFETVRLAELTVEGARQLLINVARLRGDDELSEFLTTDLATRRLKVVEVLAGGHPRVDAACRVHVGGEHRRARAGVHEGVGRSHAVLPGPHARAPASAGVVGVRTLRAPPAADGGRIGPSMRPSAERNVGADQGVGRQGPSRCSTKCCVPRIDLLTRPLLRWLRRSRSTSQGRCSSSWTRQPSARAHLPCC